MLERTKRLRATPTSLSLLVLVTLHRPSRTIRNYMRQASVNKKQCEDGGRQNVLGYVVGMGSGGRYPMRSRIGGTPNASTGPASPSTTE